MPLPLYQTDGKGHGSEYGVEQLELISSLVSLSSHLTVSSIDFVNGLQGLAIISLENNKYPFSVVMSQH
jgi:hypothetical protein